MKAAGGVTIRTLLHLARSHGFIFEAAAAPTREELASQAKARREANAREQAEREARQQEAAIEAERLRAQASESESGHHPYLVRKGVSPHGVRVAPCGVLLVPLRDMEGKLWNVQRIKPEKPPDGEPEKLYLKGGRKTGLMHWCGDPVEKAVLLTAEGLATASTPFEATGHPTAVAFDAGNLPHVAKALRGRFKGSRILVCGDDDIDTEGRTGRNPGREKATEAAKLVRGLPVFPEGLPEGGSDFNDLAAHAAPGAVRSIVEKALQAIEASAAANNLRANQEKRASGPPARKTRRFRSAGQRRQL